MSKQRHPEEERSAPGFTIESMYGDHSDIAAKIRNPGLHTVQTDAVTKADQMESRLPRKQPRADNQGRVKSQ